MNQRTVMMRKNRPFSPVILDLRGPQFTGPVASSKVDMKNGQLHGGEYTYVYENSLTGQTYESQFIYWVCYIQNEVIVYFIDPTNRNINYTGIYQNMKLVKLIRTQDPSHYYEINSVTGEWVECTSQFQCEPFKALQPKEKILTRILTLGSEFTLDAQQVYKLEKLSLCNGKTHSILNNVTTDSCNEFFLSLLKRQNSGARLFVFNQLTLRLLLQNLSHIDDSRYKLEALLDKNVNNILQITLRDLKTGYYIYIRNYMNLLPLELPELCSIFGLPSSSLLYDQLFLLHKILTLFGQLVFELWKVNVFHKISFSGVSMAIFRTRYLSNDSQLITLDQNLYHSMAPAFKGGAVDVYIPQGFDLYYYDMNSMYPSMMCKDLPVGAPFYKEYPQGTHSTEDFGIMYVRVTAPIIDKPFLIRRFQDSHNVLLNNKASLGTWCDSYFSEELKYAIKLGYQIEYIHGYIFERGQPFTSYINDLYNIRKNQNLENLGQFLNISNLSSFKGNTNQLSFLAKLLMNSFYGRLAMKPEKLVSTIINTEEYMESLDHSFEEVLQVCPINEEKSLIVTKTPSNDFIKSPINIAIAAAITAYARIEIHQFKVIPGNPCFYSDTDSVVLQYPLPDQFVGDLKGQMKLEYVVKKGTFIAPKSYCLTLYNQKEIIKWKSVSQDCVLNSDDIDSLLILDSTFQVQFKKLFSENFSNNVLRDSLVTLGANSLKRHSIYHNGVFVGTSPFIVYAYKDGFVFIPMITTPLLSAPKPLLCLPISASSVSDTTTPL